MERWWNARCGQSLPPPPPPLSSPLELAACGVSSIQPLVHLISIRPLVDLISIPERRSLQCFRGVPRGSSAAERPASTARRWRRPGIVVKMIYSVFKMMDVVFKMMDYLSASAGSLSRDPSRSRLTAGARRVRSTQTQTSGSQTKRDGTRGLPRCVKMMIFVVKPRNVALKTWNRVLKMMTFAGCGGHRCAG